MDDLLPELHLEVEQFRIGRTNVDPSYLRLKVEAPSREEIERMLQHLMDLGCTPVDATDAALKTVEKDCCAPEDFYSTTNHRTLVRTGQEWLRVEDQRMDALIVVKGGRAFCRRFCRLWRSGHCSGKPLARYPADRPGYCRNGR